MVDKAVHSFNKLSTYCEREGFKGHDPYDGLNSSFFQNLPFLKHNRLIRLAWIQLFKRSPINLRPLLGVKKEYNPKALGLFLSGFCNLYNLEKKQEYLDKIIFFYKKLLLLINSEWSGPAWGYNFDWQARAFFQPKNTPNVVVTAFICSALLDAYDIVGDQQLLKTARGACDFILQDLNRTYDKHGNFAFSYSPLDHSVVFNASLLGSRTLARLFSYTNEEALLDAARKSVIFCCNHQKEDGSWSYGTAPFHQWIDNFHTGYNLECLSDYIKFSGEEQFTNIINQGFDYYIHTFFTEEGVSKYYNNSVYPIDIHAPAQLIITLAKLGRFQEYSSLVNKVLYWTIEHMQSKKGFFYFQVRRKISSKIPYMRWGQAWMFYAFTHYFMQQEPRDLFINLTIKE